VQTVSKSPGTPVRVGLWRFAHVLHIYFVKGHRRMLGTRGNRWLTSVREQQLRYPIGLETVLYEIPMSGPEHPGHFASVSF
jgi:hypothetical protein